METKTLRAEVKTLDTEHPWGEFLVCLSAPTVDRDGELIEGRAFEPLPEHITFDVDHGLKTSAVVGSGRPYYDGDRLMVRGTFSSIPRAQEVRTLVNEGHIRTTSVAFHRAEKEAKDGVTYITKAALLNGSFVPVPANPDALVVMSKAADTEVEADVAADADPEPPPLKAVGDIETKRGRVLSAENEQKVRDAIDLLGQLLEGLTTEERQENEEETSEGESGGKAFSSPDVSDEEVALRVALAEELRRFFAA